MTHTPRMAPALVAMVGMPSPAMEGFMTVLSAHGVSVFNVDWALAVVAAGGIRGNGVAARADLVARGYEGIAERVAAARVLVVAIDAASYGTPALAIFGPGLARVMAGGAEHLVVWIDRSTDKEVLNDPVAVAASIHAREVLLASLRGLPT